MTVKQNYIAIPLTVLIVQLLGGIFTDMGMDWYQTLTLPEHTPPGFVFGIIWMILFLLGAIAALFFWNRCSNVKRFKLVAGIFIVNAILNVLWSYIFFANQLIFLALIDAILLEISIVALIVLMWPTCQKAALLLVPYAIWVLFACQLNYQILLLNT